MNVRPFLFSAFTLLASISPAIVRAEPTAVPTDVETAKHNFVGIVNGNSVFVRSAPRGDAYPTMKLDKGARVTVVGIKFKWLKVLPPEGSFAYVQKAYVNKRGDGTVGRASREMIAKVGSVMNQLKTAPMGKIDEGQDVEILGEQDEWYKIKPPEGSFVYIEESYVTPLKALPTVAEQQAGLVANPNPPRAGTPAVPSGQPAGGLNEGTPVDPLTTLTPTPGATAVTPPVVTPPAVLASFESLEADFKAANDKAIADQPVDVLLSGYTELLKQNTLTHQMRQIAEARVSTLKLRATAKADFLALRQEQLLAADQQKARVAEQVEIQQRIKEKQVTFYAVVGTLRASSIQRGPGTLFRLTDPATGRTIAYARVNEAKYGTLLGQFVGVKGAITTDPALNLKIIEQPTDIQSVDPATVNDTVAAQIVPPSLMPVVHAE